jgi:hypothetical protein
MTRAGSHYKTLPRLRGRAGRGLVATGPLLPASPGTPPASGGGEEKGVP